MPIDLVYPAPGEEDRNMSEWTQKLKDRLQKSYQGMRSAQHLYQDQGIRTVSLDVLKLHHGEEVQIEYPGDEDVLPYEPGAELTEIPVQKMQRETPCRTSRETITAQENLEAREQSLPRETDVEEMD